MQMPGGGCWKLGPGQITDDSEMALSLGQALQDADPSQGLPLDKVAFWYGRWIASKPFDIGITTRNALRVALRWNLDSPVPGMGDEMVQQARKLNQESLSNGALMRQSPLAVWLCGRPAEAVADAARRDASLTHPNPVAQDASAAYVIALAHLVANPGDAGGATRAAEAWARELAAPEVCKWLLEARQPGPGPAVHPQAGFARWGFVHAFRALHQGPSYEDGVKYVLSLGGDTDTNAAIVGAALGALHGAMAIPQAVRDAVTSSAPRGPGSALLGRPRPAFLQGDVVEGMVRRLHAAACGGGGSAKIQA